MDLDWMSSILDEVALEGLDGITLSMLWVRLQNRPNFPIAIDEDSKRFFYDCIVLHKDVEIFELPEPRPTVPLYNRYEHIDSELGIVLESPVDLVEIYFIEMVKDGNVRGSCVTYKSRKCITNEIRYDDVLLMNLGQVVLNWGDKLVLVATQRRRLLALFGTEVNPITEMSIEEYCLLERIGRSRYHGEVTQGEGGLLKLKAPFCKQMHYYRKKLTVKGLVTKQLHYMKNRKGVATTGSLFHLTRFYMQRKTKMEMLMKCMCDTLKEKPRNMETSKTLREELNIKETTFKKLFHRPFEKWIKLVNIPYSAFNPQASAKECFTCHGAERLVKVVQLIKHCDDMDNVDEEETYEDKDVILPLNIYFDASKIYYEVPLIIQIYRLIQGSGPEGKTAADLGRIITLPKLDIRTLLRSLVKSSLVVTILQERGRQKETKYIAKHFGDQNEAYTNVKKGREDIAGLQSQKRKDKECSENAPIAKRSKFDEKNNSAVLEISDKDTEGIIEKGVENQEKNSDTDNISNKLDFQKIVAEISELQSHEAFTGKAPRLLGMTEEAGKAVSLTNTYQLTQRKCKRISMILEHLKACGFSTLTDLQKHLIEKEREEGYNFKMDKKSTARMIHWLYLKKKLKIIKAILNLDVQKAEIEFICDYSLKPDDPSIQVAIEQAKFRFFSISKDKTTVPNDKVNVKEENNHEEDKDKQKSEEKKSEVHSAKSQKILQELQVHPKFLRFKTLHKFLYYLVYGYEGHLEKSSNEPAVYHDSMTWKRFVPPLPSDRKEGWCFLADIYNRMPLSVFVRTVNLRHRINEFAEYIIDEEKSNYLITHLPKRMLKSLLNSRKYIFQVDDVIKYLCYMGLVTYGPQIAKPKDQMHVYVHKLGSVKDTSISTPGYLHINPDMAYENKVFSFSSLINVEKYWVELEHISSNTPLGRYSSVVGKTFAITEANHKPELLAVLKHKNFDEILDVGFIPGDSLGASGFDSSLFLHSRRNWQPSNFKDNDKAVKSTVNTNPTNSMQNLLKHNKKLGPEKTAKSRLQRLGRNHLASQKEKSLKENVLKKTKLVESKKKNKSSNSKSVNVPVVTKVKETVKFRTVKQRQKKMRTPYMDDKDKAAMEKMSLSRSRCEWSAQEDSFLLLCRVASSFLDPNSRTIVVPYTVVRDLLQEQFPVEGSTKTSRACQRRVRYMMLNPTTTNNVAVFLGEAKQDMQLVKDFEKAKPSKTNEAAWRELFTGVLKRILEKFTLPAADRRRSIELPKTIEEFKKSFVVLSPPNVFHYKNNHKDPDNEDEIKSCILYSLIVSAMALAHDGTEWSYLLYKLYHAYPEFVLRSVVSRLRSEKVIACKKSKCKKDLIPSFMTTFPYRFSITYENTMITKFPIQLFDQSKELLEKFKSVINGEIELKDDIYPGYTVAVLALVLLNEISLTVKIPEQIILFDSTLSKEARTNIVERMMHSLSDKDSYELVRILNDEKGVSENVNTTNDYSISEDQLRYESEKKTEDILQINEVQRSTNASRFALYLLRQELSQPPLERVQHSQDYIVLNSCQVLCHVRNTASNGTTSGSSFSNQEITALQRNTNEPRGKILTDGCVSEIKASLCAFIPPGAFSQYQNFDEALEIIYDAYSPQTLSNAKCIFGQIYKAGSIGISEKAIWGMFRCLTGELSLFEHLHLFKEAMLVVRAGVASFIYICISFAKSWVLQSYVMPEICYHKKFKLNEKEKTSQDLSKVTDNNAAASSQKNADLSEAMDYTSNLDDSNSTFPDNFMEDLDKKMSKSRTLSFSAIHFTEEIYFLPRTWRHPDGILNKKAFLELLETVLSYIIHSPGVTTSRVTERFSLILQPVQTLELLEILEKAYCILKYYCKKPKKGSLFSPCSTIIITKNPESADIDHLEPLPDAICNLTKIKEAIM